MFDIGWSELLLIGVVSLIVVGPKDLPGMFRTLGRFTAKARSMAREFSRAMEDAANESGIKEAADDMKDLKGLVSKKSLGLDALEDAANRFEKWDPKLPGTAKQATTPATPAAPNPIAPKTASKPARKAAPKAAAPKTAKPAKAKPATSKPATKAAAKAEPAGSAAKPPRKRAAKKGEA